MIEKQYTASRSGLFLIELILSIFFFIVAAAIVMQLFVKSHFISEDTININHALLHTQNIAEIFLAANGDFSTIEQIFDTEMLSDAEGITAVLYFDKDWKQQNTQTDAVYMAVLDFTTVKENGPYACLNICIKEYGLEHDNTTDCIHQQKIIKYTGGSCNG